MDAIKRAIESAGSQTALAIAVGVRPQAVQKWQASGRIPAERVLQVEVATGVSRHELRPDLYPLEGSAA
jgi:DNA-binding transcriptional regulator YdaS (Cro superfamily)